MMKPSKTIVCMVLSFISLGSQAQYYKLLNLTEKQITDKVTDFPVVIRDSSKHEFVPFLSFKNNRNETQLVFAFNYLKKCYLIYSYSKKESFESTVSWADHSFNRINSSRWRSKDNSFEISVQSLPDKVVTIFSNGITDH